MYTDPWDEDFFVPVPDVAPVPPILTIEERFEPMFTSATWTIIARVGDHIVAKSDEFSSRPPKDFVMTWARVQVSTYREFLQDIGIDVYSEYEKYGGNRDDLEFCF